MKKFIGIILLLGITMFSSLETKAGVISVAFYKVGNGMRNFTEDFYGHYICPDCGTTCDMVIANENADGSIDIIVNPPGIVVNVPVGVVHWHEVGGSRTSTSSFAGMTFMKNEYRLRVNQCQLQEYIGITVDLDGITADNNGWIHVFVPHP
ncbi:MAG: hypothetical protein D8M52_07055 [Chlorobi bacterium]|nr:MAG: hypothetical protein F9K28_06310 [Bacteroidota bacterium]MBL1161461.1 hypothetical protein [Chlorobiota bacterium]MBW7853981.1 hypothetical protein [Candidatus Kapabacteria bacterium]MCC6331866.1 hypothetical protein [Ignavibacteria bacterium]MBV6463995.1 hypothetical protein [Chlorobiota bacterium]